jgi:PAS domain S-box-containing protein
MTKFMQSNRWAVHAQEVLAELDDVPLAMERAESAQLGYLLTGDESYQLAYQTAASGVEKELAEVRQLTTDNPVQRDRVATLTTQTKQRLASLQEAITAQDEEGTDDALDTMFTSGSTATKEDIDQVVADMETGEKHLLTQHEGAATANARSMRRLTVSASMLAFVLVGLAGVFVNRDVTKRRQAEAALRESEAKYRTLVENANEGILSLTREGKITSINHGLEMMLNWSREELVGASYSTILTPRSASQCEERLRYALAVERLPSMYEAESVRKDGSVVPVEVRAGFLRDGTGQIVGLLALHRDVSVKKSLAESHLDSLNDQRTQQDALTV